MNSDMAVLGAHVPRNSIIHLVLLALGVLSLTACQDVPPAPIDPAANAQRLERRALDDPAVAAALARYELTVPDDGRWSLDQLTIAAWALRTDIAAAGAQLQAARATTRLETRRRSPSLPTTFEYVTNAVGDVRPWVLGASVGLTVETAGKRAIRQRRATAQEEVLQWQRAQMLWDARVEVGDALFARFFADRQVALDDEELRLRGAYLEWVETRLAFGAASTQERLIASESVARIESQRELDRAELAGATARLAAAVGVVPASLAAVTLAYPSMDDVPDIDLAAITQARDLALVNRLDVRRALAQYEVAEQDLRAAVAAQYPDIVLGPGYLVDQDDRKITLSLDLPALPSSRAAAAIDRAVALRAVAAARFDEVQSDALAQIETSYEFYRATLGALASAQSAEAQARRTFQAVLQRLEAGSANRGEALGAEIDWLVRRRASLDTRRTLIEAVSALQNGVQRPLFPTTTIATPIETEGGTSQ